MIHLSLPSRVFLCLEPVDMRKSFDGLANLVRERLGGDPLSGDLFVFRGRRNGGVRLLYWLGDGLAIWYRRLEEGTFAFPQSVGAKGLAWSRAVGEQGLEIGAADLALLLEGVELETVQRRRRYRRPE